MMKFFKKPSGFTLLELVIALMLLTFLSVFTAQSIQKGLQNKRKIQSDIDRSSRLRGTLSVMERDLNLALNHRDLFIELHNLAISLPVSSGTTAPGSTAPGTTIPPQPTQTQPNQNPALQPKKEVILTQFIGEAEKLNFATASLVRLQADSHMSNVGEVGYVLKSCHGRLDPNKSSNCLWRRTASIIDTDPLQGGSESVLLEDVTEMKLRYLGPLKPDEWQESWNAGINGPAEIRGILPFAVEITIEIKDEKTLRMTAVVAIHNPNNLEKKNDPNNTQTTPK